jgi:hypothetical protein
MEEAFGFQLAGGEFFEDLSRYGTTPVYLELMKELLPPDWSVSRKDVWLQALPPAAEFAVQGFKIHVSVTPQLAGTAMRRVVPVCVDSGVPFKAAADPALLGMLNGKRFGRGGSGKFMTIYPPDVDAFTRLAAEIHRRTGDLEGPYILSDRRYADSRCLFYRYGGFRSVQRLRVDGTRELCIVAPDGSLVPDQRLPYFQLPEWVEDPFGGAGEVEDEEPGLLGGRFRIEEALSFSNSGGVYRAVDTRTGEPVVLKEARPLTNVWNRHGLFLDSVVLLSREHAVLERLQHVPCLPRPVALFQEWEHWFLAESFAQGVPLTSFRARDEVILTSYIDDPERIRRFCSMFHSLATQLLDAVEAIHASGVIIGDLSPNNVLVDPDTLRVTLIDLEGAQCVDDDEAMNEFSRVWATPGFRSEARGSAGRLAASDDFFALGMVLHGLVLPVESFFELNPQASRDRFIDRFVAAGLPVQVREVVAALRTGRADLARDVLETWSPPS